jgi:uncharacterized membrane protein HdeD (DUF308 family)
VFKTYLVYGHDHQKGEDRMAWFLYLIGVVWISYGTCAILYTQETRGTAQTLLAGIKRPILAAFPLVAGILFIISAASSGHPWIVRLFGVIGLIKGAVVYFNPRDLHAVIMTWYLEHLSEQGHRFLGIISVILGTAVLSWVI